MAIDDDLPADLDGMFPDLEATSPGSAPSRTRSQVTVWFTCPDCGSTQEALLEVVVTG